MRGQERCDGTHGHPEQRRQPFVARHMAQRSRNQFWNSEKLRDSEHSASEQASVSGNKSDSLSTQIWGQREVSGVRTGMRSGMASGMVSDMASERGAS